MVIIKFCPLCRSQKISYLFPSRDRMFEIPGNFAINLCLNCYLRILSPRPSTRQLMKYYPKQNYYAYQRARGGFFNNVRKYLVRHYYRPSLLSKAIATFIHNVPALPQGRPPGKILDIGCGAGETLILLKDLGWETYGLEIDKEAVRIGNKRGLINVGYGGYRDLAKYPNNYFRVIRLYHVIEHLDDPMLCLRMIKQKIKKGGEVIIGTPSIASLVARLFGTFWYNLDSPRHLFLFTPGTLKKLAIRSGFMIKGVEYCSAGGLVGSIQYRLNDKFHLKLDLINKLWFILLFYPLEWVFDKLRVGDVFVIRMTK